jgi:hypothetical protein
MLQVIGSECSAATAATDGSTTDSSTDTADQGGPRVVSIGRSRQNDISILQDEMVSRKHGEIFREGIFYWFKDVGSINGTFINQEQIQQDVPWKLLVDDHVEIGATRSPTHPCVHAFFFWGLCEPFLPPRPLARLARMCQCEGSKL